MRSIKPRKAMCVALPFTALMLVAAAPAPRTYDLRFSANDPMLGVVTSPVIARQPVVSDVAPTPNRDIFAPSGPAAGNQATLAPGLFTRGRQSRGDGFLSGSTAQEDQDRRALPGAGFNIKMPLAK